MYWITPSEKDAANDALEKRHWEAADQLRANSSLKADKFLLAIVLVGEGDAVEGPFYLRNPFDTEPGWGVSSVNYELKALLDRAGGNR